MDFTLRLNTVFKLAKHKGNIEIKIGSQHI